MKNLKLNSLLALTAVLANSAHAADGEKRTPNIIVFLADDMRYDVMGCAGNPVIQTPNLDRLAQSGVRFSNAFVTTSISACSRASILTGQYVSRHGINDFKTPFKPEAFALTYPMLMKKAGYQVGFIGKYGVGSNTTGVEDKFDFFWGTAGQPNYENKDENGNFIHYDDWVGEHIDKFLETMDAGRPFCLAVCFKAPHVQDTDPRQFIYNERYKDLYDDVVIPEPATNTPEEWEKFPEFFKENNEARIRWYKRFSNPVQYQEMIKGHHRLITGMDDVIGKAIKHLKDKGLDGNTIIIFSSDNGFYVGEHGLAGKWYAHEPSVRVPLLIYNPLKSELAGKVVSEMALNIDIAPTILSLAGIDIPESMQGKDLGKIMSGNKKERREWRTSFYYEHTIRQFNTIPVSQGFRDQRYKYIIYPEVSPVYEEIYDLKKDKDEVHNLALIPEKKKLTEQLRNEFRKAQLKAVN